MFGPEAADPVLNAWEQAYGAAATDVALFDVIAALATPPDMRPCVAIVAG